MARQVREVWWRAEILSTAGQWTPILTDGRQVDHDRREDAAALARQYAGHTRVRQVV